MRWREFKSSIVPKALARVRVGATRTGGGTEVMKNISLFSKTSTKQALRASEILQATPCDISDASERLGPPGPILAAFGPPERQAIASEFVSRGSRSSPLAHGARHVAPGRVRRARGGRGTSEPRNATEANVAPSYASPVSHVNRGEGHVA